MRWYRERRESNTLLFNEFYNTLLFNEFYVLLLPGLPTLLEKGKIKGVNILFILISLYRQLFLKTLAAVLRFSVICNELSSIPYFSIPIQKSNLSYQSGIKVRVGITQVAKA